MYRFGFAVISSCCLFAGYLASPQAKPPTDQVRTKSNFQFGGQEFGIVDNPIAALPAHQPLEKIFIV